MAIKAGSALRRQARSHWLTALIALLPALLVLGIFSIYPILYSGYLSLHDWDGFSPERNFVGLQNYFDLFNSAQFWHSLQITLIYVVSITVLSSVGGLFIALLLNSGIRGVTFYRIIYFIPVVTATVAAATVWRYLLDPGSGLVNTLLRQIGVQGPAWLTDPRFALLAVILVGVWKRVGFNMVIFLAGLQTVPRAYYEAAMVDGANTRAQFRYITLPMLAPTTLLVAIMSLIDAFLVFDTVFVMSNGTGGPVGSTEVLGFILWREAFRYFNLGDASAVGWILFLIVLIVTALQWRVSGTGARSGV
ncbi:MAG: sugar ABC transporter permease [Chloroflexi bacterium]|uniref:carbohydrate ABC transporter permease n=1 Tax=Candidatus Flexifilum breve TaxID=3140694 RepID=UPI0031364B44|nr:sugar ABC transporter permease [Chloroflexota bacterium]